MLQYEYLTVAKSDDEQKPFSFNENKFLKEKGIEGWELISVLSTAPTLTYNKTIYYFKRIKTNGELDKF